MTIKEKLLNNAHYILSLIAIVIILVVLGSKKDLADREAWETIALNFATGLIGVVVVFFFLNKQQISDEMRLSDHVEKLVTLLEEQDKTPPASRYFLENPSMRRFFQRAHQVDMLGVTLASTIDVNFSEIKTGLRRGCQYRVILADPDSAGFETAVVRSQVSRGEVYKSKIVNSIKILSVLLEGAQREGASGSIEIRLLQHATSFGIKVFDAKEKSGRIYVEFYPYQTMPVPFIELKPDQDGEWFPYFARQFDSFWQLAQPITNNRLVPQ